MVSRICPVIEAVSHAALIPKSKDGKWPIPQSFPVRIASSTLGLDPVGGIDVSVLAQPAFGAGGPVRGPKGVPPAVPGLEQGQLRAGMRPLAAREDAHRGGPGPQLVPGRSFAEQPGQLGDVRFLDPARPVRAARIGAGLIGAALADLAARVDRDLPGRPGTSPSAAFSRSPSAQPTE